MAGKIYSPSKSPIDVFFLFSLHKLSLNFLGWFNLTIQIVCYGTQIAFGKQETHFWTVIQTRRGLVLNFQAFLPGMGGKFTVLWHDTVQNGLIFHVRLHYKNHNKVKRYWVTIFGNDMRHKNVNFCHGLQFRAMRRQKRTPQPHWKKKRRPLFHFYVENIRILAGVHHNTFENYQELTKGVALNLFIVKRFKQLWIGKYDLNSIGELRITEFWKKGMFWNCRQLEKFI